ncbi:MAG: UDP-4-amino-4,6-dideoxy-N-acetyl-beta-L-altrosamine transaminase [Steroidobacteraceae bacterium]
MTSNFIPYGRQVIEDEDVAAVVDVLRSDWLTTGPMVPTFEAAFTEFVGAAHGVAVANGTAALHLCMLAAGIGPGDEVIVPALTFAASANCVRYVGADVVFADVRSDTLTIDPVHAASLITSRTRAIVAVDYAGLPADLDELLALCARHGLLLVEDACHAPGAQYRGRRVGGIAHLSAFSFHPVKHLTTGEGGLVTTNDATLAERMRRLRNHGIGTDHRQREQQGTWRYDMTELGFNYRLNDIQCALGLSQLRRLPTSLERRRAIASTYSKAFAGFTGFTLQAEPVDRRNAWHLYAVRLAGANVESRRLAVYNELRAGGIGVNVHYLPVYLHSYYRGLGYRQGLCPVAEGAYQGLLSLPMWHGLTDEDQNVVIEKVSASVRRYV